MKDKKQIIKEIAEKNGIKIIGFTTVTEYNYLEQLLIERKKMSYNNELEEQDLNRRLSAKNIFPECKSIIAIGVPYAAGYKKPYVKDRGLLSISSYNDDYHNILKKLLNSFAEKINIYFPFKYKICVDTSPLIDREICKNAGIGSYGKNSLLIHEEWGSFIFLGYILTNLEIDSDSNNLNNDDICTNCTICIKSCPNGAILNNGGINTKKCISYLTQTKTYIPVEYRKSMSNQIYGCDICQLVCPKNKKNLDKEVLYDYNRLTVDLKEMMNMTNNDFKGKYGHIAGSWRGKNIWKRNSIISITNLGLNSMFEAVKKELENPSDMIKIYAAWSILTLNRHKACDILHNNFKYENAMIVKEYKKLMEEET